MTTTLDMPHVIVKDDRTFMECETDTPPVIDLNPYQARILEAQIKDGADTYTVAARARVSRHTANRVLVEIARYFGVSRMEMVVGFARGRFGYVIR